MGDATGGNRRFPMGAFDEPAIGRGGPVRVGGTRPPGIDAVAVVDSSEPIKKRKRPKKLPPRDAPPQRVPPRSEGRPAPSRPAPGGPVRSEGKPAQQKPPQRSGGKPPQYGGKNPMDVMLGIGSAPPSKRPKAKY